MAYVSDGTIGIDLTRQVAGTTTNGVNGEFKLGHRVNGTDNSSWVYVQAGAAITQYDCVAIDENFQAVAMTSALALDGYMVGFAQNAFDDNDLGWVAVQGSNITCRIAGSCAADVQLYTSATAGVLDDTSAGVMIRGVAAITTNSTTAASTSEVIANHPHAAATA